MKTEIVIMAVYIVVMSTDCSNGDIVVTSIKTAERDRSNGDRDSNEKKRRELVAIESKEIMAMQRAVRDRGESAAIR